MRPTVIAISTGLIAGSLSLPALGADPLPAQGASITQPTGAVWTITPRSWFAWEDDSFFQQNKSTQQSQQQYFYPFYGGSISYTPHPGGTTYSITGLHGEGDADVNGLTTAGIPLGGGALLLTPETFSGTVENKRTDVEGIAQIPINGHPNVNWTLGARWINFQRNETDTFTDLNGFLSPGIGHFDLEQNFYLGELGFGVTQPVSTHWVFFGNVTGMFGAADVTNFSVPPNSTGVFNLTKGELEGAVVGVDTNAGIGYKFSNAALLSARYRLFYLTAPNADFNKGGYFIQGPEADLSIRF